MPRFREILDGTFSIDKNSTLIYHVKSPKNSSIPQQLKFSGNWSLDDKNNNQWQGDKLALKGEIIDSKSDNLEFSLSTKDKDAKTHFYMLELSGRWQADKYNRLSFLVRKEKGPPDALTLSGAWEVNKQNMVIYTYAKEILKTKKRLSAP